MLQLIVVITVIISFHLLPFALLPSRLYQTASLINFIAKQFVQIIIDEDIFSYDR